jgi:hypothetical protein
MKQRSKNAKTQANEKAERTAAEPNPPAPTPEQIRKRAQEIFEARGCAPGGELEDWLQAERELKSGTGPRVENPAN